jgi:hypothetical protein
MHSDLFTVELWTVTSTTDIGLGVSLQVSGPLATAKVIISKAKYMLRKLGFGEETQYDTAVLFKNIPTNATAMEYIENEPWMYVVVTDTDSGWFGKVFRIEGVIASHMRRGQYSYHVVAYGKEMSQDKVWYQDGSLRAKE